jgi:2'-5' RNA ligase
MINIKEILLEDRSNMTAKKGCLMAMVPKNIAEKLQRFNQKIIGEESLYLEGTEYGRELYPHVTIRYGFLKDLNELDIRQLLKGHKSFMMELYGLDKFDSSPKYDVAMFKVKSPVMNILNELSGIYLNESDYDEYHPHLTLAYVQKGKFPHIKEGLNIKFPITEICYSPISGAKSYFTLENDDLDEITSFPNIDVKISELEKEWERLDSTGTGSVRQQEISKEIDRLKKIKEPRTRLDPNSPEIKDRWEKLKQSVNESAMSMGYGSMSSNDTKLRPIPGGQNDGAPGWNDGVKEWDGIVEGDGWFVYKESNDHQSNQAGASVTITEDETPHKIRIKIKTHGLRKTNDTNESHKARIRKHTNKVTGQWISAAKKLHNNLDINEAGNPIHKSWYDCFKEALNNEKIKPYINIPCIDGVNFTYHI